MAIDSFHPERNAVFIAQRSETLALLRRCLNFNPYLFGQILIPCDTRDEPTASFPAHSEPVSISPASGVIYISADNKAYLRDAGSHHPGEVALLDNFDGHRPDSLCSSTNGPWHLFIGGVRLAQDGGLAELSETELKALVRSQFCEDQPPSKDGVSHMEILRAGLVTNLSARIMSFVFGMAVGAFGIYLFPPIRHIRVA